MLFNFKVYKAKKGNANAAYLPATAKELIFDENIEAENGNRAWKELDKRIGIKRRWHVVRTLVTE